MLKITRIATVLVVMLIIAFSYGRNAQAQERTLKSKYEFGTPELDAAQKLYSGKKYEEALAAFQSIIDKAQAASNWEELIYAMEKKALALRRLNSFEKAIETMNEAIDLSLLRLPKDHFLISKVYYTRGVLDHRLRNYYKARSFLDTAFVYYQNASTYDSAIQYNIVEFKYYAYQYSEGSLDTLLIYLDKLRGLEEIRQKKTYDPDEVLNILQGYPTVYIQKGDFEQALAYAIQGYKYAKENKNGVSNRYFAEAQFYLAQALFRKKNYLKALRIGLEAMPIVEETPRNLMPEYYAFHNLLGIIYMAIGDYPSALPYLEKALNVQSDSKSAVDNRSKSESYARIMVNLALCYKNLGNIEKGKFYLDRSLNLMKGLISIPNPSFHDNYERLGDFYSERFNWEEALISYDSALRNGLSIYDTGIEDFPFEEGLTFSYMDLKTLAKKAIALKEVSINQNGSEDLLIASKNYVQRIHSLLMKSRADYIESEGKLSLSKDFKELYETGLEVCFELYSKSKKEVFFDEALSFAKQSKSILFLEQSHEFDLVSSNSISQGTKELFYNSKNDIDSLQRVFYDLIDNSVTSDDVIEINDALSIARNRNEILKDSINSILLSFKQDTSSMQRLNKSKDITLKRGSALVEYFYGDKNIYILARSKDAVSFRKVKIDPEIDESLSSVVKSVSLPPNFRKIAEELSDFHKQSNLLFNILLGPTLNDLGSGLNHLIIVPDEFLSRLPFETLIMNNNESPNSFRGLNYLIKSYSIQYELSSELFSQENKEIRAPKDLLGMGFKGFSNIDSRSKYGSLPGTESEIKFLESSIQGVYTTEGTKDQFLRQARDFDILHLAIHGEADSTNRYMSSLVFNGNGDENVLRTNDLYLAGLRSRLAVLSACESGLGAINKGEGTFSIARGFALVGVPSLVMSLWKVNDNATSDIMVDMYKGFIDEGLSINEALRNSKLSYLNESDEYSSHPYYWGAFLQLGQNIELKDGKRSNYLILTGGVLVLLIFIFILGQKRKRAI